MSLKIALAISPHFLNKENRAPQRKNKDGAMSNAYAHGAFNTVTVPLDFVVKHVTDGKAISVSAVKDNWRKEDNFISSQLMGVDFDESPGVDGLLQDEFVRDHAFLVYPTASHTDAAPRSRVLFALDAPITDKDKYKLLVKRLMHRFNVPLDESCKDTARIFYGSNKTGYKADINKRLPVTVLEALPPHPDELKPPREVRQATVITDYETRKRAEQYALKTKQNIMDEALALPLGERHEGFNTAVLKGLSKAQWIGFENIESELRWLGVQMGRKEEEIERSIKGAWDDVTQEPLVLPERQNGAVHVQTANGSSSGGVIPQANGNHATAVPAQPQTLTWKTSDDAADRYLDRLVKGRGSNKLPLIFPFKSLHEKGGFAHVLDRGVMVGIVGMSGGTKTSFTECLTEPFRQMGLHGIWWGIEWSWEKMFDRAVQRHGGATATEMMLHEMYLDEKRLNIPPAQRHGKELPAFVLKDSEVIAKKIKAWTGKSHQIAEAATDVDMLIAASGERIKELEAQGIDVAYAVFDYMQLLDIYAKMTEAERNTTVLGKIKQFCLAHNLVGLVVSQVTKSGAQGAKTGQSVLEAEAGQFLRSDKFNLVLTLNPIYAGGLLTNQAIINVAKNSLGSTGQEWLYINPARLQWTDKIVPDQERIKDLTEVAF